MLHDRLSIALLLGLAVACTPDIPDGHLACADPSQCPSGYVCRGNDVGALRCFAHPASTIDGSDGAVVASPGLDAGSSMDSGHVGAPMDAQPILLADGALAVIEDAAPRVGCKPEPADSQVGIFVSPLGVAANCGTAAAPCATIAQGIARATSMQRGYVYLDTGSYSESVTLPAGVTLQGGWNNLVGMWTRQCSNNRSSSAVIIAPGNIGVSASYSGTSTLDTLTIQTAPAAAGATQYGVFATGASTQLQLIDVSVEATAGGDGSPRAQPATAPAATNTCPIGSGAAGADGAPGSPASPGTFTASGFVAGVGSPGGPGKPGNAGVDADAPTPEPCAADTSCSSANGCVPTTPSGAYSTGSKGPPGCGGAAGTEGAGGQGGGSSIGVFAVDATVSITGGLVSAGNGGAGGAGGAGGIGGAGAAGTAGAAGAACTLCSCPLCGIRISTPILSLAYVDALPIQPIQPYGICSAHTNDQSPGTAGGTGGNGGAGGPGGDGAAGSSYAIYTIGTAHVTPSQTTQLAHGAAGAVTGTGPAGSAGDLGGSTH